MQNCTAVIVLSSVLWCGHLSAQTRLPREGTVTSSSPVFLYPDPHRVPLMTLRAGTPIRVMEVEGDWYQVEFTDSLGKRTAYIPASVVQLSSGSGSRAGSATQLSTPSRLARDPRCK